MEFEVFRRDTADRDERRYVFVHSENRELRWETFAGEPSEAVFGMRTVGTRSAFFLLPEGAEMVLPKGVHYDGEEYLPVHVQNFGGRVYIWHPATWTSPTELARLRDMSRRLLGGAPGGSQCWEVEYFTRRVKTVPEGEKKPDPNWIFREEILDWEYVGPPVEDAA